MFKTYRLLLPVSQSDKPGTTVDNIFDQILEKGAILKNCIRQQGPFCTHVLTHMSQNQR